MTSYANLYRRVRVLEKIIKEKSAQRSHAPSKAFLIWKFLNDHNGGTIEIIKRSFPENDRNSIASALSDCIDQGIVKQNGDHYFANREYEWDDIGMYDSKDQKEILNDLNYLQSRIEQ